MRRRSISRLLTLVIPILAAATTVTIAACVGDDPVLAEAPLDGATPDVDGASPGPDANAGEAAMDAGGKPTVIDVAAGVSFGCAVLSDHTVMCWGRDDLGQSGQPVAGKLQCGDGIACRVPARVPGLTNVARVFAGGSSACAVTTTGDVECWGGNDHLQLGHANAGEPCPGGVPCSRVPVAVAGLANVTQLAMGMRSACAVDQAGGVKCWGANGEGQLGRGTTSGDDALPLPTIALGDDAGARAIAVDSSTVGHFCASRSDGTVLCWGRNTASELGTPSAQSSLCDVDAGERCISLPRLVYQNAAMTLTNVSSVAAMGGGACVALVGGDVWCWGYDGYATTGEPLPRAELPPASLGARRLSGLSGALNHMCGLAAGGVPQCWGMNEYAALGALPSSTPDASCAGPSRCSFAPVTVPGIQASRVVANFHVSYAVTMDGRLFGWGSNANGNLGHIPTVAETKNQCPGACSPTPVEIAVP